MTIDFIIVTQDEGFTVNDPWFAIRVPIYMNT